MLKNVGNWQIDFEKGVAYKMMADGATVVIKTAAGTTIAHRERLPRQISEALEYPESLDEIEELPAFFLIDGEMFVTP